MYVFIVYGLLCKLVKQADCKSVTLEQLEVRILYNPRRDLLNKLIQLSTRESLMKKFLTELQTPLKFGRCEGVNALFAEWLGVGLQTRLDWFDSNTKL